MLRDTGFSPLLSRSLVYGICAIANAKSRLIKNTLLGIEALGCALAGVLCSFRGLLLAEQIPPWQKIDTYNLNAIIVSILLCCRKMSDFLNLEKQLRFVSDPMINLEAQLTCAVWCLSP